MKYYGKFSGDGKAVAFYVDTINDIPVGAIALSEPQWRELVENQHTRRFIDGQIVEIEPPAPPPTPIPTITPRQLRLWLLKNGLLDSIPSKIETMPDPMRSIAKIEWEYATTFDRKHEFIEALGSTLGLSSEQLDEGFREASKI